VFIIYKKTEALTVEYLRNKFQALACSVTSN